MAGVSIEFPSMNEESHLYSKILTLRFLLNT